MGFPDFSMFDELEFEALSHTYSFKGETLPNVSSIMAPLTTEKNSGISQAVLDKAAERETTVHNSIENFLKYEIDDIEPEYSTYFQAFQSFWADYRPKLIRSEIRMYHPSLCCRRWWYRYKSACTSRFPWRRSRRSSTSCRLSHRRRRSTCGPTLRNSTTCR